MNLKNLFGKIIVLYLIRGKRVFYVTGMRRSGNHAFINWFANALEECNARLVFKINNIYVSNSGRTVFLDEVNIKSGKNYLDVLWNNRKLVKNSQFLIISTEDCDINYKSFRIPRYDKAFFVKRSLLNLIASRWKFLQKKANEGVGWPDLNIDTDFFNTLQSWESPPENFYIWEYEKWIESEEYRIDFLNSLGLDVDILPNISSQGGGSSFTGQHREPTSDEALNRYKQVEFSEPILDLLAEEKYRPLLNSSEREYLREKYSIDV